MQGALCRRRRLHGRGRDLRWRQPGRVHGQEHLPPKAIVQRRDLPDTSCGAPVLRRWCVMLRGQLSLVLAKPMRGILHEVTKVLATLWLLSPAERCMFTPRRGQVP